jgi:BirA family biotin operon repressor/biotin-[acetyl-CoA-carboxylase] ligase
MAPAEPALGRTVVRLREVVSTQAVAFAMAEAGAGDGTVVVAEHQTGGRGRLGRTWHDEPGANLLLSMVVRPRLPVARLPLLSYVAAIAVAETLARTGGVAARLKWPNDVLVGGRKIAGILLESRLVADPVVVVGIGINVGQRRFPPDVAERATSLALATGEDAAREPLLAPLLQAFDVWRARLEAAGWAPVRDRWTALSETVGRQVRVGASVGLAVGLDDDGGLLLAAGGAVERVVAGALEP